MEIGEGDGRTQRKVYKYQKRWLGKRFVVGPGSMVTV